VSEDIPDDNPLGQIKEPFRFYSGEGPVIHPPARIIGSVRCITQGETPGDVTPGLVDGFDQRCWVTEPDTTIPLLLRLDVTDSIHQLLLGDIQQTLYTDPEKAREMLLAMLGAGSTVQLVPNSSSLIPGSLVGVQGELTVVVVSGTGNPQQLALQGLLGLAGPVNQGTYSTVPLWQSAALAVQNRVFGSPANQTGPIVLVGHSYGGAVVNIMTARYLQVNPTRDVQLLTWGCPLPGDERLILLTRNARAVNLVNDGDVITALPPTGSVLEGVSWLLPSPVQLGWGRWRYPLQRVGLSTDGERRSSPNPNDLAGIIFTTVRQVLLVQPIPSITAHDMSEYLRRMGKTVPPEGDVLPGTLVPWGGATVPAGYIVADGVPRSRTIYSDLFAYYQETWGPGDGSTTFGIPDFRNRTLFGAGQAPGFPLWAVGQYIGELEHALTIGELPSHAHVVSDPGHSHGVTDPGHVHSLPFSTAGGTTTTMTYGPVNTNRPGLQQSGSQVTGVSVNSATTGVTTDPIGTGDPVPMLPPGAVIQVLIKT